MLDVDVSMKLFLTVQAIIIWMIVFSAAVPVPRLPSKWAVALIVTTSLLSLAEMYFWEGAGLLITSAVAGYGWGCIAHHHVQKKLEEREKRVLDE